MAISKINKITFTEPDDGEISSITAIDWKEICRRKSKKPTFHFFQRIKHLNLTQLMNIPPRWSTSVSELVQISSCVESKSLVQMSDIC